MRIRHGLRQPALHRRRGASAVRRRQEERQRASIGCGPDRSGDAQDGVDRQPRRRSEDGPGADGRGRRRRGLSWVPCAPPRGHGNGRIMPTQTWAWDPGMHRKEASVMGVFDERRVPDVRTELPGPKAKGLLERDERFMSPSYTRIYPLVCARGSGAVIEDVDGNLFLDFTAGIAVTATGHCHPEVVAAIRDQAGKLLHMSGTDFYYEPQIDLAQRLAELAPGAGGKRV